MWNAFVVQNFHISFVNVAKHWFWCKYFDVYIYITLGRTKLMQLLLMPWRRKVIRGHGIDYVGKRVLVFKKTDSHDDAMTRKAFRITVGLREEPTSHR